MRFPPEQRRRPREAAHYLGVSVDTLESWRSQQRGPAFIKIGGRIHYEQSALDAYLELRRSACDEARSV